MEKIFRPCIAPRAILGGPKMGIKPKTYQAIT